MLPESVFRKMTEDEQLDFIAALEANNKVLKEKNDIIEQLYNENQQLKQELEELKSSHPGYQLKEMNEFAEYAVTHKEEIIQDPNSDELLVNILKKGIDNDLEDEQIKQIVFDSLSMANKFRLHNKIEGTDSEKNIIIPN